MERKELPRVRGVRLVKINGHGYWQVTVYVQGDCERLHYPIKKLGYEEAYRQAVHKRIELEDVYGVREPYRISVEK